MKIKICDVCKINDSKITEAKYIVGKRKGAVKTSLDVCEKHKDFSNVKTIEEINNWYLNGSLKI